VHAAAIDDQEDGLGEVKRDEVSSSEASLMQAKTELGVVPLQGRESAWFAAV
jgi:hypothetical protein